MSYENLIDEGGYMTNPDEWSIEFAEWYANKMGIDWSNEIVPQMVQLVHDYIQDHAITPSTRAMQKLAKKNFGIDSKQFYSLFPNGPKQVAMLAGGMKPSGC